MSPIVGAWLRRPSRVPRSLRAALAAVLGTLATIGLAAPASSGQPGAVAVSGAAPAKLPDGPGAGNPVQTFPSSPALKAEGSQLYQSDCSSCHGISLKGTPGVAPSLVGVGAGPVDFYLSTGRMPLSNPHEEPERNKPLYDRRQIDALIDFVSSFGGPPAPTADPARGDLAVGLHQFTLSCAGCHQIVARGGLTLGAVTPNLQQASSQQIAEAVRMGPYLMPRFDARQVDQHQLDSIARYVLWTRKPDDAGGWGIYNIGPIPEGIVAWFLALAALVIVARLIGERTT
ncbi:MAG TPA: c-type cytochrome [Solirubrobacteraceae bacterium]|jgi:ubiquinol-cytochrome c reductase cytochrome c subunit